jgi:uncharacterized repeat protein (TIGR03803 family)
MWKNPRAPWSSFACLLALLVPFAAAQNSGPESSSMTISLRAAGNTPVTAFKQLHSFCREANCSDGAFPSLPIQGLDGNFYGVTYEGGLTSCNSGCGTVYRLTPTGRFTTIYTFCAQTGCPDGAYPSLLILGKDGYFYGITSGGGLSDTDYCPQGCGTFFRMSSTGVITTLHLFDPSNEMTPQQIVQGADGNFYGSGIQQFFSEYSAVFFKLTPKGDFTDFGRFFLSTGGVAFAAADGSIYGTMTPACDQYCQSEGGTVFSLSPEGKFTTVYDFCPAQANCTNGVTPTSLFQGKDGALYGTNLAGGPNCQTSECGTAFRITPSGKMTILHEFCSSANCADGSSPIQILQGTDGNFYGTTATGGRYQAGTIFRLTSAGTLTTLHNFCGPSVTCDSGFTSAGLLQEPNGVFFGTVPFGGSAGRGSLFDLSVGLGPFVQTLPAWGSVGQQVKILGTSFTGSTAVSFNGTAATFEVVSATEIAASVPTGATSGVVTVTTPSGTLSSNVRFVVTGGRKTLCVGRSIGGSTSGENCTASIADVGCDLENPVDLIGPCMRN